MEAFLQLAVFLSTCAACPAHASPCRDLACTTPRHFVQAPPSLMARQPRRLDAP